jgi:two-component system alkaline phosphatase synthesis response regulator PhoP
MIYLLEDDDSIRKLVVYALKSQGYNAEGFERPSLFWRALEEEMPELVLLDIMLPEEDGLTVLRRLRGSREYAHLPVILLTAKSSEYDKVEGLDAGADDYVVKPFGMMELVARVRSVLRRSRREPTSYRIGVLTLSPEEHLVTVEETPVALTNKEFALLRLLTENQGKVLGRSFLMDRVWGLGNEPENRTLDVHIRTLRAKLGTAGEYIETVRGVGYRLRRERA